MVDCALYMPYTVSMSSPESEYNSTAIAAMGATQFHYLDNDFLQRFMMIPVLDLQ